MEPANTLEPSTLEHPNEPMRARPRSRLLRCALRVSLAACALAAGTCAQPPIAVDGGVAAHPDATRELDAGSPDAGDLADVGADASPDGGRLEPRRALFVGNSYTYFNDLPVVVRELAAASGVALEVEVVAPGGAKLCDHQSDAALRERIRSGEHDSVVIQGQSVDMFYDGESAYFCAESLGHDVRGAGARLVWFATWARREGDEFYSRGRGVTTPAEMTDVVEGFYRNLSRFGPGGHVARVGRGWERALAVTPGLELHAADGSHPSPLGTLAAACTLAQAILGRAPALPTPPPLGLDAVIAQQVCDLATREPCFDDLSFCGGECRSVAFDAMHCGACDAACPSPRECWRSECRCAPSFELAVTPEMLRALDPSCDPSAARPSVSCARAAHLACADLPCGGTGVGPWSTEAGELHVSCARATLTPTTFTELSAHHAECDGVAARSGDACLTAAHRACIAAGAAAGFGPLAIGDDLRIACLERAFVRFVPDAAIDAWGCPGYPARPWDTVCDRVVHTMCTRMGHTGGYGPLVSATGRTDGVDIACFTR